MSFCPECGVEISKSIGLCPKCRLKHNKGSFKNYTTTLLLCLIFGLFGIHRFYVGKIFTGILMLLSIGCFGIWTIIDLILINLGIFKDRKGDLLDGKTRFISIFGGILSSIVIFLISYFLISSYIDHRAERHIRYAQNAYHAVALAEEKYYSLNNKYTVSLNELKKEAGLIIDDNIEYDDLKAYFKESTQQNCFTFKVKYKVQDTITFLYDSCSAQIVQPLLP
jgi:hypothetical protein